MIAALALLGMLLLRATLAKLLGAAIVFGLAGQRP